MWKLPILSHFGDTQPTWHQRLGHNVYHIYLILFFLFSFYFASCISVFWDHSKDFGSHLVMLNLSHSAHLYFCGNLFMSDFTFISIMLPSPLPKCLLENSTCVIWCYHFEFKCAWVVKDGMERIRSNVPFLVS